MSDAARDVQDEAPRAVHVRGRVIELVTGTGAREPAALVYRSAGVDETAFGALYDPAAPRVYGLAVRTRHAPVDADEVGRDPYLEVWRTSTSFEADRTSAMAWIMAMAHRRAVDRLRSPYGAHPAPPGTTRSLGRRARRKAGRASQVATSECDLVREALSRLTPEQQAALELVHFDGYARTEPPDLKDILATLVDLAEHGPDHVVVRGTQRLTLDPSRPWGLGGD